jgi:hypothetical protein
MDKELKRIRDTFCNTLKEMIMRVDGLFTGNYILRLPSNTEVQSRLIDCLLCIWDLFEHNSPIPANGNNIMLENYYHLFRTRNPVNPSAPLFVNRMYLEAYDWFDKELARLGLTVELMGIMAPAYLSGHYDDVTERVVDLFKEDQTTRAHRFAEMIIYRLQGSASRETREDIKALRALLHNQKADAIKTEFIVQASGLLMEEFKGLEIPKPQKGYFWEALMP